jgi:hypothetical protein
MVNYYDKLYQRSTPEVEKVIEGKSYREAKEKLKEALLSYSSLG